MSCYNWESGTIKLPSKAWAGFRTNLLKAWNNHYLSNLEKAKTAHKALTTAIKGKRGKKREEALKVAVERRFGRECDSEVFRMVVTQNGWGSNATYTLKGLPKKKDLPLKATSKDAEMYLGDAYVAFKNATKTLVWNVSENNRAVERAHEHWFAKLVFAALGKITWTRGSGGKCIGNDEYNRDADYEGGGGNYVTMTFSAEEQKRQKAARARNRSSFGGMGRYY
jgi:hypothetical protein